MSCSFDFDDRVNLHFEQETLWIFFVISHLVKKWYAFHN